MVPPACFRLVHEAQEESRKDTFQLLLNVALSGMSRLRVFNATVSTPKGNPGPIHSVRIIYILGPDDGILDRVELFLSEADPSLCLNSSKSETHSLDVIRDNGISLL